MGKRKGDDVIVAAVSTVVTVEPTTHSNTSALTNTTSFNATTSAASIKSAPEWLDSASYDHKLRVVRETLKLGSEDDDEDKDDFLRDVNQCRGQLKSFQQQQTQLLEQSNTIQQTLQTKIDDKKAICQKELSTLSEMEDGLREIVRERDSIQRDISELNRMRESLETKIALAMEEANQEVEQIDLVEEERKKRVPRLKHQISLYAQMTGIKWDYHDGDVLQGEVSIPSKEVIRSFEIDPRDYSRFEVAQKLWNVLDPSKE